MREKIAEFCHRWKTTAVWMLEVNGFIIDIRNAPRELQEKAYRLGLIPFIP